MIIGTVGRTTPRRLGQHFSFTGNTFPGWATPAYNRQHWIVEVVLAAF